jgi:ketosteroid isomerase-like protein
MKKLLYLGAVAVACGAPQPSRTETENKTREIVSQVFEAFNAHDWARMESLYSNNVKLQDPAYPGGRTGKTGMTNFYRSVNDIHDTVSSIVVENNVAVVEFVSTGTINGEKFSLPICTVLVVENGQVIEDRTYYDATP